MYNIKLPSGSEFILPKESIRMLAHLKSTDCGVYKNFLSDEQAITFLEKNGIEVKEAR